MIVVVAGVVLRDMSTSLDGDRGITDKIAGGPWEYLSGGGQGSVYTNKHGKVLKVMNIVAPDDGTQSQKNAHKAVSTFSDSKGMELPGMYGRSKMGVPEIYEDGVKAKSAYVIMEEIPFKDGKAVQIMLGLPEGSFKRFEKMAGMSLAGSHNWPKSGGSLEDAAQRMGALFGCALWGAGIEPHDAEYLVDEHGKIWLADFDHCKQLDRKIDLAAALELATKVTQSAVPGKLSPLWGKFAAGVSDAFVFFGKGKIAW